MSKIGKYSRDLRGWNKIYQLFSSRLQFSTNYLNQILLINIVACFLGNAARNLCRSRIRGRRSLDNYFLHSRSQPLTLITHSDVSSSKVTRAPLISVERSGSSFLSYSLSYLNSLLAPLALVGYELTSSSEFFFAYILRSVGIVATFSNVPFSPAALKTTLSLLREHMFTVSNNSLLMHW
jgi:hypothetical protein